MRVELNRGAIFAGVHNTGILHLFVPEPIARAERVNLQVRCGATARYSNGKNSYVARRTLAEFPFSIEVPGHTLAAGHHQLPFAFDAPPFLSGNFVGIQQSLDTSVEAQLVVDWALDPHIEATLPVVPYPQSYPRTPLVMRSPPGFHQSHVVEVSLDSSVVKVGEPLVGQLALRGSGTMDFRLVLSLRQHTRLNLQRPNETRIEDGQASVSLLPAQFASGQSVPFYLPTAGLSPFAVNGLLDVGVVLEVTCITNALFGENTSFRMPVLIAASNATLYGSGAAQSVGQSRLAHIAEEIAKVTPLRPSRALPALAEGQEGAVYLTLYDAPSSGVSALGAVFTFPDLDLGLSTQQRRILDVIGGSSLTPKTFEHLTVAHERERTELLDTTLAALVAQLFQGLEGATTLSLVDNQLRMTMRMPDDSPGPMVQFARAAYEHVSKVNRALQNLSFPKVLSSSEAAWRAAAANEGAALLPSRPSLSGIQRTVRVASGEQLSFEAHLQVSFRKGAYSTELTIHASESNTYDADRFEKQLESLMLTEVRVLFSEISVGAHGTFTLRREGACEDPLACIAAVDAMVAWYLSVVGERRIDAPYR
jgi:hypothetical protein